MVLNLFEFGPLLFLLEGIRDYTEIALKISRCNTKKHCLDLLDCFYFRINSKDSIVTVRSLFHNIMIKISLQIIQTKLLFLNPLYQPALRACLLDCLNSCRQGPEYISELIR